MANKKRILITTGIYPPDIGGPAQYAVELAKEWKAQGYKVKVKYFSFEKSLPTGIRHLFFFLKILPAVLTSDFILTLDTWSAALPTSWACSFSGKEFFIRTGGDFLWESVVERTKRKILFHTFYSPLPSDFNWKERWIFKTTRKILQSAKMIVFSTNWQREVWQLPYEIDRAKTVVIENYYGERIFSPEISGKIFIASARSLVWKNTTLLRRIFEDQEITAKKTVLDLTSRPHDEFLEAIHSAYAVILISLGDISPNMILDAIRCGKPFIVTRETGIYDRIKDIALFVDPLDEKDIKEKILWLLDDANYKIQHEKVKNFTFTHTWKEIADEFLSLKP